MDDDGEEATDTVKVKVTNVKPRILEARVTPTDLDQGEEVNFSAKVDDTPSDLEKVSYTWDMGDGKTYSTASGNHSYEKDGEFTVTLTVRDDDPLTRVERTFTVTVTDPTPPPPPPPPPPNGNDNPGGLSTLQMAGIGAGIFLAIIIVLAILFLMRRRASTAGPPSDRGSKGDTVTETTTFEELPEDKPPAGPPPKKKDVEDSRKEEEEEDLSDEDVQSLVDDIDKMLDEGPKDEPKETPAPGPPPTSPDDKKLSHFAIETERKAHDGEIEMNK
jgi:PKD repeat protein